VQSRGEEGGRARGRGPRGPYRRGSGRDSSSASIGRVCPRLRSERTCPGDRSRDGQRSSTGPDQPGEVLKGVRSRSEKGGEEDMRGGSGGERGRGGGEEGRSHRQMLIFPVVLNDPSHDGAFAVPEDQSTPSALLDREQVKILSDRAMVSGLCLFEKLLIETELSGALPGRAIDSLGDRSKTERERERQRMVNGGSPGA
jgi:hypothetical protein